jgi:hypothetical protein
MSKQAKIVRDNNKTSRQLFEAWIGAPPYECDLNRWPKDEARYAWPGHYRNGAVQLAWEAWRESAVRRDKNTKSK